MTRERLEEIRKEIYRSDINDDLLNELLKCAQKWVDKFDPEYCYCGGEWFDDSYGDLCSDCGNIKGWNV